MFTIRVALSFLLLSGVCFSPTERVSAQPQKPSDFFEKDYVTQPRTRARGKRDPLNPRTGGSPTGQVGTATSGETRGDGFTSFPTEEKAPTPNPILPPQGKPVKAFSIGLIVNGQDAAHLYSSLVEGSTMTERHGFTFAPITIVGNPITAREVINKLATEHISLFAETLGQMAFSSAPPREFDVTRSPTWIVATKEGRYVLDGVPSLQRYFTAQGLFIAPDGGGQD